MVSFYARNHTAVKQRRVGIELLKVERFYQNANNKVKETAANEKESHDHDTSVPLTLLCHEG